MGRDGQVLEQCDYRDDKRVGHWVMYDTRRIARGKGGYADVRPSTSGSSLIPPEDVRWLRSPVVER